MRLCLAAGVTAVCCLAAVSCGSAGSPRAVERDATTTSTTSTTSTSSTASTVTTIMSSTTAAAAVTDPTEPADTGSGDTTGGTRSHRPEDYRHSAEKALRDELAKENLTGTVTCDVPAATAIGTEFTCTVVFEPGGTSVTATAKITGVDQVTVTPDDSSTTDPTG